MISVTENVTEKQKTPLSVTRGTPFGEKGFLAGDCGAPWQISSRNTNNSSIWFKKIYYTEPTFIGNIKINV